MDRLQRMLGAGGMGGAGPGGDTPLVSCGLGLAGRLAALYRQQGSLSEHRSIPRRRKSARLVASAARRRATPRPALRPSPPDLSAQADTSEQIYISSLALLKMLKHGRAGVPLEVMGLMLGEFVDEYTVKASGTAVVCMPLVPNSFPSNSSGQDG